MIIGKLLGPQLQAFAENPRLLDKKLYSDKYSMAMHILASENMDVKMAFAELATNIDISVDQSLINIIKDISMIQLDYLKSYEVIDEKSLQVRPELVSFLAKYLVKRRATYLYIYMLFQKKHVELLKIHKLLGIKYQELQETFISQGGEDVPVLNIKTFLAELQKQLLDNIKSNETRTMINDIFLAAFKQVSAQGAVNHVQVFADIGKLLEKLTETTSGYKQLVTDVIPLMAEWNETVM